MLNKNQQLRNKLKIQIVYTLLLSRIVTLLSKSPLFLFSIPKLSTAVLHREYLNCSSCSTPLLLPKS
jgi:hypothetical protein